MDNRFLRTKLTHGFYIPEYNSYQGERRKIVKGNKLAVDKFEELKCCMRDTTGKLTCQKDLKLE